MAITIIHWEGRSRSGHCPCPCPHPCQCTGGGVVVPLLSLSDVGIKMACLESLSTTTKIVVYPVEAGSCSIKSMDMEFQGLSGTGSCFSNP